MQLDPGRRRRSRWRLRERVGCEEKTGATIVDTVLSDVSPTPDDEFTALLYGIQGPNCGLSRNALTHTKMRTLGD